MTQHPIQPLEKDEHGVIRFKKNAIVEHLLDNGGLTMNDIASMPFDENDREQFSQLIGYSLSGFSELGYATDTTYETASKMASSGKSEQDSKIEYLESLVENCREAVKMIAPELFRIHPDDLEV